MGWYLTALLPQFLSEQPDLWKRPFHFFGFVQGQVGVRGPTAVFIRAERVTNKCCAFLVSFFLSAFQEDLKKQKTTTTKKKQNKKPRSLSAFKHTLFLYRKKKPKEQHVLVKSLLSPPGLFFGSGFS